MSIEDRLTRALAAEAETIDVDVEDLRARTRDRLSDAGVPERARRRASRGPLLLAAAASVAFAATGCHVPGDRGAFRTRQTAPNRGTWT